MTIMMDKIKYDLAYNIISPIIENCIKANQGKDGLVLIDYAELRDALAKELTSVILRARKKEHDATGNIFGIGWDDVPGIEALRKQWAERNAVLMKNFYAGRAEGGGMTANTDELDEFVEELLAQAPMLVTSDELALYKERAQQLFNRTRPADTDPAPNSGEEELLEKLAAIEHERWADWQTWVHKVINEGVEGTTLEQFMERWDKQIATPYAALSEAEKQSDRDQVMRYWPLLLAWHSQQVEAAIQNVRSAIR